jgi:hypothetical protein
MVQSGSQAVYLSGPGLGTTGRVISTGMSITLSTFGKATMEHCPRGASVQPNTVRSFTDRQCMTPVAMKLPAAASKSREGR